jgi:hypothetical protein
MRIAKVIVTCYMPRAVRLNEKFPCHNQNIKTVEDVQLLLNTVVELEIKTDPGMLVDTIIVNNNSGYEMGNRFLESISGRRTKTGKLIVIHRENYGRSFGGYNFAFQHFRDIYTHWLFLEDDVLLFQNQYGKNLHTEFISDAKIGFIAVIGTTICKIPHTIKHAHGGCGFTSTKILKEVCRENNGILPHCSRRDGLVKDHTKQGEMPFTEIIDTMGYLIIPFKCSCFYYDYITAQQNEIAKCNQQL